MVTILVNGVINGVREGQLNKILKYLNIMYIPSVTIRHAYFTNMSDYLKFIH